MNNNQFHRASEIKQRLDQLRRMRENYIRAENAKEMRESYFNVKRPPNEEEAKTGRTSDYEERIELSIYDGDEYREMLFDGMVDLCDKVVRRIDREIKKLQAEFDKL